MNKTRNILKLIGFILLSIPMIIILGVISVVALLDKRCE